MTRAAASRSRVPAAPKIPAGPVRQPRYLKVRRSPLAGLGVFTTRAVPKGTLLLEYLAQRPQPEGADWLRHVSHIVALLGASAAERQTSASRAGERRASGRGAKQHAAADPCLVFGFHDGTPFRWKTVYRVAFGCPVGGLPRISGAAPTVSRRFRRLMTTGQMVFDW